MAIEAWSDSILIAELNDEPLFSEDMSALTQRLKENAHPAPDVIVNLAGVTYLTSSNIAQLLKLRKRLLTQNRRLKLCAASETVRSELAMMGLEKIFETTEDVSTSLAALQMGV